MTTEHVWQATAGHGVDERTVWRWLGRRDVTRPARRERYWLSETDREAYAFF